MQPPEQKLPPATGGIQTATAVLCAIATVLLLAWILRYTTHGFDFSDEGFYLTWIANPYLYDFTSTHFAFIYHPVYQLLDGNIARLRQVNVLVTFALAWGLAYMFLTCLTPHSKAQPALLLTVTAGLATSALILFDDWLSVTPNYNSLALQALLLTSIGMLLTGRDNSATSILPWTIIGAGGWLAFMAKPPTALALAVLVLLYLLVSRKIFCWMVLLAPLTALVLLLGTALVIDGSIGGFIQRFIVAMELAEKLGSNHSWRSALRLDSYWLNREFKLAMLFFTIAAFLGVWAACAEGKGHRIFAALICASIFILVAVLTLADVNAVAPYGSFPGLLIAAPLFAAGLAGLVMGWKQTLSILTTPQGAAAFLFLAMPYAYAFSTNLNYWRAGSSAGVFWVLAGLTVLAPIARARTNWSFTLPLVLAAQAITATLLQTGLEQPYRQPQPLRLNATVTEIGPLDNQLVLSEEYATYVTDAMASAHEAGFDPGTPLLDLSGQSPGILFALGAESIGHAWMIGGYAGSLDFAKGALARTPCQKIATAWLLLEPDGPRSIPKEILPFVGIRFPEGFERVGAWQTAKGAGGAWNGDDARRTQHLYKPVASQDALDACQTLREKQ